MCAPCSLPTKVQIRVEPIDTVLLYTDSNYSSRQTIHPKDGMRIGTLDGKGWMFIHHPHKGVGKVGLPLYGTNGSWKFAFEHERVELYIRSPKNPEWKKVKRWDELPFPSET